MSGTLLLLLNPNVIDILKTYTGGVTMAGDKFKGLFDFINNFGDATVNASVHEPASGKTSWIFGRSEDCDFVYPAPKA